jgi:hypothetical protein
VSRPGLDAATTAVWAAVAAAVPACLAAMHVANVPDAAHDDGVLRVLGLAGGPWRAVDVALGNVLALLPVGTRGTRAALGGALVLAATGAALYALVRRMLAECADTRRLGTVVAGVAAVLPLVGAPWQIEASSVGGSTLGALLALLPLALATRRASSDTEEAGDAEAFALGLAIGDEPLVGLCAVAGYTAFVLGRDVRAGRRPDLARAAARVPAFVAGLAPFVIALGRTHRSGAPIGAALYVAWAGERGASHAGSPLPFLHAEAGSVLVLLAAIGAALAMFVARARPLALALAATAGVGLGSAWLGAPVGPTRFGAPVLAGLAATAALAAIAMQAIVRMVAQARIPMARTSAAMIVLLEAVMPVDRADEALAHAAGRASGAAADWGDAAWGTLPARAVVLVSDRGLYARALADEARGAWRPDLALVPLGLGAAAAWRPLADAALVPLRRDLELAGKPSEEALSTLAVRRPVAAAFDPAWGRALARHLVPLSLLDRFEPEPRGATDRRRLLDALAPAQARLARSVSGDPELLAAATSLLQARESGVALDGDKDVLERVAGDVASLTAARKR